MPASAIRCIRAAPCNWSVAAFRAAVGDVARHVTLRFCATSTSWTRPHFALAAPARRSHLLVRHRPQRVVDIAAVVTVSGPKFRIRPLLGLEVFSEAGTLLAINGDVEVRTPHRDAVMVMPVPQTQIGQTAVRIGASD